MDWNIGIYTLICVACMVSNLGSDIDFKIPVVINFSIGSAIYGGALDHVLLLRLVRCVRGAVFVEDKRVKSEDKENTNSFKDNCNMC